MSRNYLKIFIKFIQLSMCPKYKRNIQISRPNGIKIFEKETWWFLYLLPPESAAESKGSEPITPLLQNDLQNKPQHFSKVQGPPQPGPKFVPDSLPGHDALSICPATEQEQPFSFIIHSAPVCRAINTMSVWLKSKATEKSVLENVSYF